MTDQSQKSKKMTKDLHSNGSHDDGGYSQAELGNRVRAVRKAARLTLADISGLTGLSQGFLSQVENGVTAMSIASLYLISAALNVPATLLLADEEYPQVSVLRAGSGPWYEIVPGEQAMTRDLTTTKRRHLEARESTLPPNWTGPALRHLGEELLHVVSGTMTLELVGLRTEVLGPRDTMVFPARIPHRWGTLDTEVRLIDVVCNPNSTDVDHESMQLHTE